MKPESQLFAGVAVFFLLTDVAYIWFAREPAGTAALTVSFLMSALISLFCGVNHRRKGTRPEDRRDSEIQERSGLVDFFPPHSTYPVVVAVGMALMGLGVVYALFLFVIGLGITLAGVYGMTFQYAGRDD
ncbi:MULTISPECIES: cytochrome c oxidase subunit 4 [unclassified Streptomyces]|uniref:aa3-type cytochrome oxidase subunit IV n=1 Tax=unclassified Streptomyces TaxID=2593676 RepID=UPI0036E8558A